MKTRGCPRWKPGSARCWPTRAVFVTRLIPDEQALIEAALIELTDVEHCSLILTTGGTGPAPRDVTPEATLTVAHNGATRLRRADCVRCR